MEDENQQLRAQINAAPAHASREQHACAISNSSPSHAVHDFFSVTEGGEGVGFGSATGFGNSGGMVEVKAKPKLGEGAQVKAALGTGAVAAAALPNYCLLTLFQQNPKIPSRTSQSHSSTILPFCSISTRPRCCCSSCSFHLTSLRASDAIAIRSAFLHSPHRASQRGLRIPVH